VGVHGSQLLGEGRAGGKVQPGRLPEGRERVNASIET